MEPAKPYGNYREGVFRLKRATVIVTIDAGKWHLSISCLANLPSYNEMKAARYKFIPDEFYMAEIFPPKAEFVNLHPYTRHLWQISPE